MLREHARIGGILLIALAIASFIGAFATEKTGFLTLAAPLLVAGVSLAMGFVGVPRRIAEVRAAFKNHPRREKYLNVEPMTFRAANHPLVLVIIMLLFGSGLAFSIFLLFAIPEHTIDLFFTATILGLSMLSLGLYVYNSFNTAFVADRDCLRMESPFKKAKIPWNQILDLESRFYSGRMQTKVYKIFALNTTLDFSDQLPNSAQLVHVVKSVLDADDAQDLSAPIEIRNLPPSEKRSTALVALLGTFGGMFLLIGVILALVMTEDVTRLFVVPRVSLMQAAALAGTSKVIRVQGKLHNEYGGVRMRDGTSKFALELIEVSKYRNKQNITYYTGWVPLELTLSEGTNKLKVKVSDLYRSYITDRGRTLCEPGWEKTKVGNLISPVFDGDIKPYETKKADIQLYTLDEGENVTVIGKIVRDEKLGTCIVATDKVLWISNRDQQSMERDLEILAAISGILLAFGIAFSTAAVQEFRGAKKGA